MMVMNTKQKKMFCINGYHSESCQRIVVLFSGTSTPIQRGKASDPEKHDFRIQRRRSRAVLYHLSGKYNRNKSKNNLISKVRKNKDKNKVELGLNHLSGKQTNKQKQTNKYKHQSGPPSKPGSAPLVGIGI